MDTIYVIKPNKGTSPVMTKMLSAALENQTYSVCEEYDQTPDLRGKKLLFVMELDEILTDLEMLKYMKMLYSRGYDCLQGCSGAVFVHSTSDLGTKRAAQSLIFLANNLGCTFIGHPLVEATSSLRNFLTWQKTMELPLEDICSLQCRKLVKRLLDYQGSRIKNPKVAVLYSTPHKTSNTLDLWNMVKSNLEKELTINEIQIENGEVLDCKGCSYTLCIHYGNQNSCFYGGIMIDNVLPAVENCDAVVWLCPNYNDSIAANLTAVVNRLTVLYNKMNFYNKSLFGIVVSGNSGSDSVAMQLIGSMNINKGFRLPPYAVLTEISNDPGAIFKVPGIYEKARHFSRIISGQIRK